MRSRGLMRYYQSFPTVIPQYEAGSPRVTHPSATNLKISSTEVSIVIRSVRLACVRHAASVHPEPGSNSLIKCMSPEFPPITTMKVWSLKTTFLAISRIHCLSVIWPFDSNVSGSLDPNECKEIFENRLCFTVQLSRFLLFSVSATAWLDYHNQTALSTVFFN